MANQKMNDDFVMQVSKAVIVSILAGLIIEWGKSQLNKRGQANG